MPEPASLALFVSGLAGLVLRHQGKISPNLCGSCSIRNISPHQPTISIDRTGVTLPGAPLA